MFSELACVLCCWQVAAHLPPLCFVPHSFLVQVSPTSAQCGDPPSKLEGEERGESKEKERRDERGVRGKGKWDGEKVYEKWLTLKVASAHLHHILQHLRKVGRELKAAWFEVCTIPTVSYPLSVFLHVSVLFLLLSLSIILLLCLSLCPWFSLSLVHASLCPLSMVLSVFVTVSICLSLFSSIMAHAHYER